MHLYAQLCPTLCNPMQCSPPGSSVHGILQAKTLECLPHPSPGDLPNQGSNLCLLHWQADSLPLSHLGISLQEIYANILQYVDCSNTEVGLKIMAIFSYICGRNCFPGRSHKFGTKSQAFKNILF